MVTRRQEKTWIESIPLRALGARATPAVLALLGVTLIAFHKADILPVEKMRVTLTDAMTPVLQAVSAPFNAVADNFEGVQTLRALKAENIRLREENAKLQAWYETALKLQAENKALHQLLNVKADPGLQFVTARIVSDPGGAFVKSVLLPVGSIDNVGKGNAVLSGQGLIGRVTEAGRHSARVLLINDLNSRIPVVIQNTRTKAILAGKNGDLLKLERLPPDSGLTAGQRIVTSGDGGQLPPDIPVGTIVSIGAEGVFVKPLADLHAASYVQVINTAYDPAMATGDLAPAYIAR